MEVRGGGVNTCCGWDQPVGVGPWILVLDQLTAVVVASVGDTMWSRLLGGAKNLVPGASVPSGFGPKQEEGNFIGNVFLCEKEQYFFFPRDCHTSADWQVFHIWHAALCLRCVKSKLQEFFVSNLPLQPQLWQQEPIPPPPLLPRLLITRIKLSN